MVTKENFPEVIKSINPKRIKHVLKSNKECILLEVFVSNAGFVAHINSRVYSRKTEKYAEDNGQLFMYADNFCDLLEDYGFTELSNY